MEFTSWLWRLAGACCCQLMSEQSARCRRSSWRFRKSGGTPTITWISRGRSYTAYWRSNCWKKLLKHSAWTAVLIRHPPAGLCSLLLVHICCRLKRCFRGHRRASEHLMRLTHYACWSLKPGCAVNYATLHLKALKRHINCSPGLVWTASLHS